jgi:hypothetical protein
MPTGLRSSNMSDNNDAGGNAGGGQNNDGGAQNQNQGGDGKNASTGGNSSAGAQQQNNQGTQGGGSGDKTFTQADVDRLIADRLARAKQQHDAAITAAKENASKPLQEQLDAITKQLTDRQAADIERNGKLALSQVYSTLAESGLKKADVADMLEMFDPKRLLKDGEPDDELIAKFAKSLAKTATGSSPGPWVT